MIGSRSLQLRIGLALFIGATAWPGIGSASATGLSNSAPSITVASALTWSLPLDFRAAPNQSNPSPDRYGNPKVWSYMQSASNVHDPATYSLLPNFETNNFLVSGLEDWFGPNCDTSISNDCLPKVGINATGVIQTPFGIKWPAGAVLVHPWTKTMAVVGWTSPVTAEVAIRGRVHLAQTPNCGNGVRWNLDKGSRTLAAGNISQAQPTEQFATQTFVHVGQTVYLTINSSQGNDQCDSTVANWMLSTA